LCKLSNLTVLNLQNNLITGAIPQCLGDLKNLTILSLNNNKLSGYVPKSLSKLQMLGVLQLQCNHLYGSIEGVFNPSTQLHLVNVDISDNEFTGLHKPLNFYTLFLIENQYRIHTIGTISVAKVTNSSCSDELLQW